MTHLGAVNEKSTKTLRLLLTGPDGAPVNPGSVSGVRLWIRDLTSDTLLADNIDGLAAGGAVGLDGAYTFPLTAVHTAAVGTPRVQRRVVTLHVAFTDGTLTHEVSFDVVNLTDIT